MKYFEVTVQTDSKWIEIISNAMFESGADGVSILDSSDYKELIKSDLIWDYVDEDVVKDSNIATASTLILYDEKERFLSKLQETIKFYLQFNDIKYNILSRVIENQNWNEEWKKHFNPIRTPNITIVPEWIEYMPEKKERILKINPCMAFGSGEHATTRMCLSMMDVGGKSVIDVGCGSGILGLSAKILGAKSVLLTDIDEEAIKNAVENAEINGLKNDVKIICGDLINEDVKADVILANLTADILKRLSRTISQHLEASGEIIASGIIEERQDEVIADFAKYGFMPIEIKHEVPWVAMRFVKHDA